MPLAPGPFFKKILVVRLWCLTWTQVRHCTGAVGNHIRWSHGDPGCTAGVLCAPLPPNESTLSYFLNFKISNVYGFSLSVSVYHPGVFELYLVFQVYHALLAALPLFAALCINRIIMWFIFISEYRSPQKKYGKYVCTHNEGQVLKCHYMVKQKTMTVNLAHWLIYKLM